MGGLLIGVCKLDHLSIVVGSSQEAYPGGKVVARISRGDDDGGNEY